METKHTPQTTLLEIKEYLKENYETGCICPACNQNVKMYKRKLSASMAFTLIKIWKYLNETGTCNGFLKYQYILDEIGISTAQRADWQKLVYFKVLEQKTTERGSPESGKYRITDIGIKFLKGERNLPDHCKVYNGKVYGYAMEQINIKQALRNKFNYDDLMNN